MLWTHSKLAKVVPPSLPILLFFSRGTEAVEAENTGFSYSVFSLAEMRDLATIRLAKKNKK